MNRPVANIDTTKRDLMGLVIPVKEFIPSSEELSGNARNPELQNQGKAGICFIASFTQHFIFQRRQRQSKTYYFSNGWKR